MGEKIEAIYRDIVTTKPKPILSNQVAQFNTIYHVDRKRRCYKFQKKTNKKGRVQNNVKIWKRGEGRKVAAIERCDIPRMGKEGHESCD